MHSLNHNPITLTIFCTALEKAYNIATLLQCTIKSQSYNCRSYYTNNAFPSVSRKHAQNAHYLICYEKRFKSF